jgi:hypothetical protein
MIHQPMGGTSGQASDIEIQARELIRLKKELNRILSETTGKPIDRVAKDTERDHYMSADEACAYGIVDKVVTKPTAIVTINIDQFETSDPTKHCLHAGKTNKNPVTLGSLNMARRTVMFRGVQSRPATESWGGNLYRGWTCSYEFLYKPNLSIYNSASSETSTSVSSKLEYVGWDVLQPLSGFNVKAFDPDTARADQDSYGQPLKQDEDSKVVDDDLALPDGTAVGDKVRAMVKIGIRGGYTGQRPSAQPIPLNTDGTPRSETANPKVIVFRYKVTEEIDFLQTFNLRLF